MYQKKLIAIIIIFSMILGIVPKSMAKATSEKEAELPFSITETLKGVQNEKVVAKELDITDDNTEEIELGVPNVILLKQDLGNGSVKCYYVGTRGLIYDFILSQNDYESWLEKSFTHAGQIIFEPIQYTVEDDTNGTSYYYYHDIYWVRNSEGKFDFINIATCKYYEYSCDEMGEILPYNFISYKKDGKLGFLNKGGEKLTDAKYTHTNNYRWYDWIDKHTIIAWHGEEEDGTSCYDIIKDTKEVWEKRLWSINTRENVPIMWVRKGSLREEGVGIVDLSNGKEKWFDDQFVFSALSGETVIVTKDNDSAKPETWLLTKDTSIPLTSKLGGAYCWLDYADTDVVYVEAYSEVLDSITNRYKKEYTYQGLINAKSEKIYGTSSPEVWGWSVIRVDGNYIILYNARDETYKVVNMDGKDMFSFTSEEYLYSSEFSWYGERYLSYPEKGNGRWLVNLETGKKRHYDSQINLIKETNDDLYIWTQGKKEYQISSFEKEKEYIKQSEDMNDKINCAYCDDKGNVLIVIKDWGGKQSVLDENLENILVGEESVVTNQGYIICDNTVYNLNGEKVKTPVYLHTTEADSNGIYLVQKEESAGTTTNYGTSGKFTYMDGKGNILSNYIYEEASEFSNGLAYVRRYGDDDISEVINHRGESIVKVVCDNRFEYDVFNKYNDVQQNHGWWARNNREMLKYTDGLILRNGNHYYLYDFSNVPREEFDTFPAGNDSTESTPAKKVKFQLGEDNNSFRHFYGNSEDYYCSKGDKYSVTKIDYIKKLANSNRKEYIDLLEKMDLEWKGSCYGISLAMLLNKNGMVNLKGWGVNDFYDIKPYTNIKARDFMNYLYLSQYSSAYGRNKLQGDCTNRPSWLERLAGVGKGGDSLSGFLEKFVNEIEENQHSTGLPVAFGYIGDNGHMVLATGISHSKSEYIVDIYDMNQRKNFMKMTISDDYSSFSYNDGEIQLEKKYKYMYYLDTQKLLDAHLEDSENYEMMTRQNISADDITNSTIYFNEGTEVINGEGKRILCDEEGFAGDMKVDEIFSILSDTAEGDSEETWGISAEESDEYEILSTGTEVDATIYDSNQYISLEGKNISYALANTAQTTVTGNQASYKLSMDSSLDNCDVISISASSDNAIYSYGDSKIEIKSESGLSNVEVTILNDLENRKENISMTANNIEIFENADNENQIIIEATDAEGNVEKRSIEMTTDSENTTTIPTLTPTPTPTSPTATPKPTPKTTPKTTTNSSYRNTTSKKVKKPSKVTDLGLENKKKRKLVVSWLWQLDVSGFQIQYAQNKKFTKKKKSKFVGKWTSRKTITQLKKGKTYYVRVRAYKKSSGKKIYGKWSKIKKIKIRK